MDETELTPIFREIPCLPFVPVKFVSEDDSISKANERGKPEFSHNLDGVEVRKFYENIVSCSSSSTSKTDSLKARRASRLKPTIILKTEPPVNVSSNKASKFLLYAQEGKLKEVESCLEAGCNINQTDNFGWTALMCAVCAGHLAIVKLLLQNGANSIISNSQGCTALDIAKKNNASDVIVCLLNPELRSTKEHKVTAKEPKSLEDPSKSTQNFCTTCGKEYSDSKASHERSIAHLFSCGKRPTSTYYHIPESNKGFQIMLKDGWDKERGLGPRGQGSKYPVKTVLKQDRSCIGSKKLLKPKITHFGAHDVRAVKRSAASPPNKTVVIRERTLKKWEREKVEKRTRQKEINFRRQFNMDM